MHNFLITLIYVTYYSITPKRFYCLPLLV